MRLPRSVRGRVVQEGYDYWTSKLHDGRLPARRDLDPAEIPALLPHTMLLDVQRAPWNFRFRLIGTHICFHLAADWTGRWVSAIPHLCAPDGIFEHCQQVAETGQPRRARTPYVGPYDNYRSTDDIILPLAGDGRTVDMLLVFVEFVPKLKPRPAPPARTFRLPLTPPAGARCTTHHHWPAG